MDIHKIIFMVITLTWAYMLWEAVGIMDEVRKELRELANDVMRLTKRAVDGWVRLAFLDGSLTHPQLTQIPLARYLA